MFKVRVRLVVPFNGTVVPPKALDIVTVETTFKVAVCVGTTSPHAAASEESTV